MGKAFNWFRGLLGLRKPNPTATPTKLKHHKWRFAKSHRETEKDKHRHQPHHQDNPSDTRTNHTVNVGPDEHAVAVAAATAAVAEAAVAAAQAAAAVVKLTSSGRCVQPTTTYVHEEDTGMEWAAIKIQAAFRGFLARKALRALRGLVRLQALVRGHIERKRTAEWVQRMQALLKAQARARAGRIQPSELMNSSVKSSYFSPLDPATPEKFEHSPHTKSTRFKQLQRTGSRFTTIDDEKIDRILEIENERAYFKLEPKNLFNSIKLALSSDLPNRRFAASREPVTYHTVPDLSSCDTRCLSPMEFSHEVEESSFFSVSSKGASTKKSPFTPTKSDNSSRSYFSGDSEYPNYMACTQSSKAKMRSHSAPRQRPQYERSSSAKRYSVHGFGESRLTAQQISTLQSNFIGKAYPGSGRLDKLGMPVCY